MATATFRLSAAPCMGIRTDASVAATSSGDSPVDSRPTIMALDLRQSTSRCTAAPDKSAAIVRIFRERHQATAAANDGDLHRPRYGSGCAAPEDRGDDRRLGGEPVAAAFCRIGTHACLTAILDQAPGGLDAEDELLDG